MGGQTSETVPPGGIYDPLAVYASFEATQEQSAYLSSTHIQQGSSSNGWVASTSPGSGRVATSWETAGLSKKRNGSTYYTYYLTGSAALVGQYPALPSVAHSFA